MIEERINRGELIAVKSNRVEKADNFFRGPPVKTNEATV